MQRFERSFMVLKIPVRLVSQIGICLRNLFIWVIVVLRTRADNTGIYQTELKSLST